MIEARKHLTPRPGVCGNWITPIVMDADGEAVAIIQSPKYSQVFDPAQREAEGRELAHLFAAAPDLLAALERMLDESPYTSDADSCECGENGDGTDEAGNVCEHIQAHRAIAWAKGEG